MSNRCDGCCRRPGQECVRPRAAQKVCFSSKQWKDICLVAGIRQYAFMRERMVSDHRSSERSPSAEQEVEVAAVHHGAKAYIDEWSPRGNSGETPPESQAPRGQDLGGGT